MAAAVHYGAAPLTHLVAPVLVGVVGVVLLSSDAIFARFRFEAFLSLSVIVIQVSLMFSFSRTPDEFPQTKLVWSV